MDYARFFAAAECTLDDFYIFDGIPNESGAIVDFSFSYINPQAERRLGVPRESLYGKILTEVRPFMIESGLIHKHREVVRTGIPYTCEVFIDDEMIKLPGSTSKWSVLATASPSPAATSPSTGAGLITSTISRITTT